MQTICTLFQTDNHMCTNTSYAVKISSVHSVVYFAIFRKLANPCGLVIRPIVSLSRALQLHSVTQRSRTGGTEKKQKTSPRTGQSGYAPVQSSRTPRAQGYCTHRQAASSPGLILYGGLKTKERQNQSRRLLQNVHHHNSPMTLQFCCRKLLTKRMFL